MKLDRFCHLIKNRDFLSILGRGPLVWEFWCCLPSNWKNFSKDFFKGYLELPEIFDFNLSSFSLEEEHSDDRKTENSNWENICWNWDKKWRYFPLGFPLGMGPINSPGYPKKSLERNIACHPRYMVKPNPNKTCLSAQSDLHHYIDEYKLLSDRQHAFRKGHSCETQLTTVINDWAKILDNRGQVDTFILDFEKAFDTPPHELLKSKLFRYGIGGKTLKWIDSFLCFRQQRVVVNGVKSDWAPVLSGVPQGTVLGPLLFSLYINDISSDIESEIRLFADDCVCYREIKDEEDTLKLQRDIDRLGSWARKWGMRFQPVKCNMMQLTRKRINKIHASYTLEGTNLENVESIKYLGVTITSDLRWNTHVSNVCTKANRTLGFLRRNLYSCPQEVKEAAYKGLVHPVLDYGSSVWDPPGVVLQEELESVQKRAARFVTGNYNYETGSMTGILGQLKWESLKKRRKDNRLILLYKGLKGKASVPTDDLIPKTRRCRNQHSMAFQTPIANTDVYKGSFFPQTIRDWNALPDSLISSAEDAEDCVAKFTSLVRARD